MNEPRKYFFFDSGVIEAHQCENAKLLLVKAHKDMENNPMLREEYFATPPKKWEVRYDNGYPTVFWDQEKKVFRLYYTTFIVDRESAETGLDKRPFKIYKPGHNRVTALCYAESKDGVNWVKPNLDLVEFKGNKANNIILRNAHGASVLYDPGDADISKRYKLITKMRYSEHNSYMAIGFSSNGIEFTAPQAWPEFNPPADTHNFVFRDMRTNKYTLITRLWKNGVRIAAISDSLDFFNWTRPVEVARGSGFANQIYSMPVFRYADIYLGLASLYHDGDKLSGDYDTVDLSLLYSNDLTRFDWIEPEGILLERGKGKYPDGAWDSGCVYASSPVEIGNKIWIYYMGGNGPHTNFRETALGRASLDKDKFAYYRPSRDTKEMIVTLRPANFYGKHLRILADIEETGWIKCELLEQKDVSLKGRILSSTTIKKQVGLAEEGWYNISFSLPALSCLEDAFVIRFRAKSAKIYAIEGDLVILRRESIEE